MQFHEFLGKVQNRARLSSEAEALKVTRATLQTISERLNGNEAKHLLSQLPEEIRNQVPGPETDETFGLDEFYRKVSDRENAELPDAVYHSRVVMNIVSEAVSPGQIEHLMDQLPEEYCVLFEETGPRPDAGNRQGIE